MIDFNILEEFALNNSGKGYYDFQRENIIKRGELITIDDINKMKEIFIRCKFKFFNKTLELLSEYRDRNDGKDGKFIIERECESCHKIYHIEDDETVFKYLFFDDEWLDAFYINKGFAKLEYNRKTEELKEIKKRKFLCSKCQDEYNKKVAEAKRKTLEEKEKREAEEKIKQEEKERQYALSIERQADIYYDKYLKRDFDFYDAVELFFDIGNKEKHDIIVNISNRVDILDFLQTAFSEPNIEEKERYIRNCYSYDKYKEFLNSEYWKIISFCKRTKVGKCQFCGTKNNLAVHHKNYKKIHGREHIQNNIDNEMVCLCWECHEKVHSSFYVD